MAVIDVTPNDDDTLTISLGNESGRFVEIEPLVFRSIDGTSKIVFQEGKDGKVAYLFPFNSPPQAAIHRPWYDSSLFHWTVLGVSVGIFATAFLFWPAIAFSVRGLQSPRIRRTWFSAVLSCLAWLMCLVSLGFVGGLGYVLMDPNEIAFGLPKPMKMLMAVTQVCAVLAGLTIFGSLIAWRNRYWRFTGRLHYTLVALAGVAFVWFLYNWNLLTFGLNEI